MIIEINKKQTKSNFFIFDGDSFQAWNYWEDNNSDKDGKMSLNINRNDIQKIIVVMRD